MSFLENNTQLLSNEYFDEVTSMKISFKLEEAVGGNPWVAQKVIALYNKKGMSAVEDFLGFSLPNDAIEELAA